MTNRESNVANAALTTLGSSMGTTDLTATVADTSTFPSSPCYVCIDPDDDDKREIIYMDGTFTGTTLVTTDIANRYYAGSAEAGPSPGITHDTGAKVIVAAGLAQLWVDINDRVSNHDHDATDLGGVQLDHGILGGLADFTADHGTDHDTHDHTTALGTAALGDLGDVTEDTPAIGDAVVFDGSDYTTAPVGLRQVVVFSADDTFTKADYSWLRHVRVHCVGAGGGGASSDASNGSSGGGGGGGAYASSFIAVATLGASETVTVGAGGSGGLTDPTDGADGTAASFGTHVIADFGEGGGWNSGTTQPSADAGGAGGAGTSTGDITVSGSHGGFPLNVANGTSGAYTIAGMGGAAGGPYGGGGGFGYALLTGGSAAGTPGRQYGGGGGGGVTDGGGDPEAGGDGADGVVIVELYG